MNDRIFNDSLSDSEYLDALKEPKDTERVKTGLVMFSKLKEFIGCCSDPKKPISYIDDFPNLYNRHKAEYKKQFQLATDSQFRKRYISKAERLLTGIKVLLPTHIDTTEFIICERYLREYLSGKPKNETTKSEKLTYQWTGKRNELKGFYHAMRDKSKLILPETTYEQFKYIFTGEPVDGVKNPIRWHDNNASELLYFIGQLFENNLIIRIRKTMDYQLLKACFVDSNGHAFNQELKSLYTAVIYTLSEEKQAAIERLIHSFTK